MTKTNIIKEITLSTSFLVLKKRAQKLMAWCWMVQVGDPNMDHRCWERPEDMDTPRNVYKVSDQNPGSDVAAETAAALAAASIVFKDSDPSYSAKLLHTAMKVNIRTNCIDCLPVLCFIHLINKQLLFTMMQVFDFADRHRGSYSDSLSSVVCPFYCSYSGYHVRYITFASSFAYTSPSSWPQFYQLGWASLGCIMDS